MGPGFFYIYSSASGAFEELSITVGPTAYWVDSFLGWISCLACFREANPVFLAFYAVLKYFRQQRCEQ